MAYDHAITCLEQNITENEKVRFFNIVKNKNAPFFVVYTSVNLKKVRFFFNI